MREASSLLVLFVLLAFGVSLAFPAGDVPETAYDESEVVPCECTPLFSLAAPKAAAAAQTVLTVASPCCSDPAAGCQRYQKHRAGTLHPVPDSLTILNCSLRC